MNNPPPLYPQVSKYATVSNGYPHAPQPHYQANMLPPVRYVKPIPAKHLLDQTPENYDLPIWQNNPLKAAANYSITKSKPAVIGFWLIAPVWAYMVAFLIWFFLAVASAPNANDQQVISTIAETMLAVGFGVNLLLGIPALVLSHIGLYQCQTYGYAGRAYAIWGIILGYLPVVFWILGMTLFATLLALITM